MQEIINKKKKILFVDDDKFLLDMYALKFSKAGYDVRVCDSSEKALKILNEGFVPDIILTDIVMPGMDGMELILNIRDEKLAENSVIIMLTNQGTSEDLTKAVKIKVDGYIVKATTIPSEVLIEVEKIYVSKSQA
ncbi:MAG: response regulator [Candidatus Taylorbacteria bacterium]